MSKEIEQRIAWINKRVPLNHLQISYIKFQMQEHTKPLIDEIAELRKEVEYQKSGYVTLKEYLKTDDILGAITKLKSELKASKSEANEAVEFARWKDDLYVFMLSKKGYMEYDGDSTQLYSLEQLYEIFKTLNNK